MQNEHIVVYRSEGERQLDRLFWEHPVAWGFLLLSLVVTAALLKRR